MTNYELKMPANYAAIDAEEMTYLVGGETTGWQMFKDIGTLLHCPCLLRRQLHHQQRGHHRGHRQEDQ